MSTAEPHANTVRFCVFDQGRTPGGHPLPCETRQGDYAGQSGGDHGARGGEQHARTSKGDDRRQAEVRIGWTGFFPDAGNLNVTRLSGFRGSIATLDTLFQITPSVYFYVAHQTCS